jgi:hypothetical protein
MTPVSRKMTLEHYTLSGAKPQANALRLLRVKLFQPVCAYFGRRHKQKGRATGLNDHAD